MIEISESGKTLDARGLFCPSPVMQTNVELSKMQIGEILTVLADDGEDISVEEIEFDDVHRLIAEGEIEDQMSIAALLSAKHVYMEHIKISKND